MPESINTVFSSLHTHAIKHYTHMQIYTHLKTTPKESQEILKPLFRQQHDVITAPSKSSVLFSFSLSLPFSSSFLPLPWCPSSLQCTHSLSSSNPVPHPHVSGPYFHVLTVASFFAALSRLCCHHIVMLQYDLLPSVFSAHLYTITLV